MRLLVSACLLGVHCRYDGGSNQLPALEALLAQHDCIPVCPELLGGLPPPGLRQSAREIASLTGRALTSPRHSTAGQRKPCISPHYTTVKRPY